MMSRIKSIRFRGVDDSVEEFTINGTHESLAMLLSTRINLPGTKDSEQVLITALKFSHFSFTKQSNGGYCTSATTGSRVDSSTLVSLFAQYRTVQFLSQNLFEPGASTFL